MEFERIGDELRCLICGHLTREFSRSAHRCNFMVKPPTTEEIIQDQRRRKYATETGCAGDLSHRDI